MNDSIDSSGHYVHGYTEKEFQRLTDQAGTLTDLLHYDTTYPTGSRVLEAGCGVGAQTVILSRSSPGAYFECIDISEQSLATARQMARMESIKRSRRSGGAVPGGNPSQSRRGCAHRAAALSISGVTVRKFLKSELLDCVPVVSLFSATSHKIGVADRQIEITLWFDVKDFVAGGQPFQMRKILEA